MQSIKLTCATLIGISLICISCEVGITKRDGRCKVASEHNGTISIQDVPEVMAPFDEDTIYSNNGVQFVWKLPKGEQDTDLQILFLESPFSCDDYNRFEKIDAFNKDVYYSRSGSTEDNSDGQVIYQRHIGKPERDIIRPVYLAYRLRAGDTGNWSPIRTLTVLPMNDLERSTIGLKYDFEFQSEDVMHEYYSGLLVSDSGKLDHISRRNNLELENIELIFLKTVKCKFLSTFDDGKVPFEMISMGYDNENISVYPFHVFAQIKGGAYEYEVEGNNYDHYDVNMLRPMMDNHLQIAYLLNYYAPVGNNEKFSLTLTFEVYSELETL